MRFTTGLSSIDSGGSMSKVHSTRSTREPQELTRQLRVHQRVDAHKWDDSSMDWCRDRSGGATAPRSDGTGLRDGERLTGDRQRSTARARDIYGRAEPNR